MKVDVRTTLGCSAEKAWNEVQKSALLEYVIWPLAKVTPVGMPAFPKQWHEGLKFQCKSFVFCFIPIGVRTLFLERLDEINRELQSREHDPLIRRWDHLISIKRAGSDQCIYRDEVDIDAGIFTYPVWLWATGFTGIDSRVGANWLSVCSSPSTTISAGEPRIKARDEIRYVPELRLTHVWIAQLIDETRCHPPNTASTNRAPAPESAFSK